MTLSPRLLAAAVAAWIAAWLALGAWVGYEVNALQTLSDTVVKSGVAVQTTGSALAGLGALPVVGGELTLVGRRVTAAGASAVASGRASRTTVDRLAILLGIAVGLVPTAPVLVLYLVLRRLPDPRRRL